MRWPLVMTLLLLTACGPRPVVVSPGGAAAFEVDLASDGERVAIAWYDDRHGIEDIYLRLFDRQLNPLAPEQRLSSSPRPSWEPDVALIGTSVAVAWYERAPDGRYSTWLGLWDVDGTRRWLMQVSGVTASARIPLLLAGEDRLFIAWLEDGGQGEGHIRASWFDLEGKLLGSPRVIGPASATTWNINGTLLPDGSAVVVFDAAFETRANELYLAELSPEGSSLRMLGTDDGHDSKYPDIAIHAGRAALAWQDWRDGNEEVWLALLDWPLVQTTLQQAQRITESQTPSQGAYLAWNAKELVLFWNDAVRGWDEIHYQYIDWNGGAFASARVLTRSSADSRIPSPAAVVDGFVVAWSEVSSSGGHGGLEGSPQGEIQVLGVPAD